MSRCSPACTHSTAKRPVCECKLGGAASCRYKQPNIASTADVLDSYSAAVSAGQGTPGPQPLYQEAHSISPPQGTSPSGQKFASAADFQVLRLAAGDLPGDDVSTGLGELLRPAGAQRASFTPSCIQPVLDRPEPQQPRMHRQKAVSHAASLTASGLWCQLGRLVCPVQSWQALMVLCWHN